VVCVCLFILKKMIKYLDAYIYMGNLTCLPFLFAIVDFDFNLAYIDSV